MAFLKNMNNDNSLEKGSEFLGSSTILNILREVSMIDDVSEKSKKLESYVQLMKAEMLKIDGFKRELPFCMELLNDGIKMLNKERLKWNGKRVQPVMDEFMSMKNDGIERAKMSNNVDEKKTWLSSAHLWTTSVEYEGRHFGDAKNPKSYHQGEKGDGQESQYLKMPNCLENKGGGAFIPFKRQKGGLAINNGERLAMLPPPPPSAAQVGPHQKRVEKKQMRRCWSPQLHRRFVDALRQLGGAKMATPKQIVDLMQVDGLTSDEVKSHLQKYRIHLRKLESSDPGDLAPPLHDDPSLKLTMAIVSPPGRSTDNGGASSSKAKSDVEE